MIQSQSIHVLNILVNDKGSIFGIYIYVPVEQNTMYVLMSMFEYVIKSCATSVVSLPIKEQL